MAKMLAQSLIVVGTLVATCNFAMAADCAKLDPKADNFVSGLLTCVKSLEDENKTLKRQTEQLTIPIGAVIAFDDPSGCGKLGENWRDAEFGGKLLVGAVSGDTRWNYRLLGGRTSITIDPANLPPVFLGFHNKLSGGDVAVSDIESLSFTKPNSPLEVHTSTIPALPIDIMPPYAPIFFCKRVK
jgi:hypothetical protein